jgi:hypothetical protein
MNKYANPADKPRIHAAISLAVCSGKSVIPDETGKLPHAFRNYDLHEVAICASDMICDGQLIEVGENADSVLVINASNGCKPTRVVPAKGLRTLLNDLRKPQPNFWEKHKGDIWLHVIKHLLSAAIGGLIVWLFK